MPRSDFDANLIGRTSLTETIGRSYGASEGIVLSAPMIAASNRRLDRPEANRQQSLTDNMAVLRLPSGRNGPMRLRCFFAGVATLGALAAACSANAGNLIVNGGFEASSDPVTTPPGWTNIGHMDGVIPYSEFGPTPYEGLNYYDEGGFGDAANAPGDGIEQTVNTVAGQHYTLTFGLSGENQSGVEIADVTIGSQLTQYTLTPDGSGTFQRPLTTETLSYIATGATTTIAFTTDASSPSLGANDPMIDGVIFSGVGGVPEPATWAMMLFGLGGLGAVLRAHRRADRDLATLAV